MTKREKELQKLRNQIARLEASREAAIKALVKAEAQLPKLGNRLRRLTARDRKLVEGELALGYIVTRQAIESKLNEPEEPVSAPEDDDIPTFLDRTPQSSAERKRTWILEQKRTEAAQADKEARAEIKAQQAAEKKRKSERRIAKLKISQEIKHAELTGQRRKMPLTGKAALAAIKAHPSAG